LLRGYYVNAESDGGRDYAGLLITKGAKVLLL